MPTSNKAATVEELLAHVGWLRLLAQGLTQNSDDADDLAQDTWIAAQHRRPEARESLRPWFNRVARNSLRMRSRSAERRRAREQVSLTLQDEVPTPEALVAKAELQTLLVGLVLRLKEPYRSTVLLHFFEGIPLAEIARSQEIAASTARWRLKTALDQLKTELDKEAGGRQSWLLMLTPLPQGVLMAQKAKLTAPIVLLLLLAITAVLVWRGKSTDEAFTASTTETSPTPPSEKTRPGHFATAESPTALGPDWLSQAEAKTLRIAGHVVFRGKPVAGARVVLASLATEAGFASSPLRMTDAQGYFDFGIKPAMEWSVRASAPKGTSTETLVDTRTPSLSPPADQLELKLGACDASYVGRVSDASGGPIAGARIASRPKTNIAEVPGGVSVTTDDSGHYELCVRPSWPLWTTLLVSAEGYGAFEIRKRSSGQEEVNFELVPEASIAGRVVRDDTGAPIGNALVFVPRGPGMPEASAWRGTFSRADGTFTIAGLAPGRHRVLARAEGMVMRHEEQIVAVEAAMSVAQIEIRLSAGSRLRGVVRAEGGVVSGARVVVHSARASRFAPSAISQLDGSFVLTEVPQGEAHFSASPYAVLSPRTFLVQQERHDGVTVVVEPLGTILGHVVRGQRAIAGARIDIHGPNENQIPLTYTDDAGRFEIRGLLPGPWILFASSDKEGAFGKAPQLIELERNETKEVRIDLAFGAAIDGVVVDQSGNPVPGLSVLFTHTQADDQGTAITNAQGRFSAAMMSGSGYYRAQVRPSLDVSASFAPASDSGFPLIFLDSSNATVSDLVLAIKLERATISGSVVDSAGALVADARVTATMTSPGVTPHFNRWTRDTSTTTDVGGQFVLNDLPTGNYALQALTPAGSRVSALDVAAGTLGVSLALPTPGSIEGALVGFGARPTVSATSVAAASVGVPILADTQTNSFSLPNLAPGDYRVTATTDTQSASAQVVVTPGQAINVTLTATNSARIRGRVFDFKSKAPIEGMRCQVLPRTGDIVPGDIPSIVARTDKHGEFKIPAAPPGDVLLRCAGLERLYSDGLRALSLAPDEEQDVDVPIVAWQDTVAQPIADIGADMDADALAPRLTHVRADGPAALAGLLQGDLVTEVDHESVTELSPTGVHMLITNRVRGSSVFVSVSRDGETIQAKLILGGSK